VINLFRQTKEKYRKGRIKMFCGTVHYIYNYISVCGVSEVEWSFVINVHVLVIERQTVWVNDFLIIKHSSVLDNNGKIYNWITLLEWTMFWTGHCKIFICFTIKTNVTLVYYDGMLFILIWYWVTLQTAVLLWFPWLHLMAKTHLCIPKSN